MPRLRPTRRLLAALLPLAFALALLLAPRRGNCAGDPDLDWWTIETAHFRVHHPRSLGPIAERVARLVETVHERLVGPLGHAPSGHTEIVLTDDSESANGSARAVPFNAIRLYVTAPDDLSPLGDYDDWYLGLVTHEYTHILHTDNVSGIPAILNVVFGKTLTPNRLQPNWIIEGLAVVQESRYSSGGRMRSSLFDMYLRADVLEDRMARLDQISSNAERWPGRTLWYLYGARFLGFISDLYGPDVMRAVAADYGAALIPGGVNRAIRRATGRTYPELYQGFADHLRRRYGREILEVSRRGLREGKRLTAHGSQVASPRFVPRLSRAQEGRDEIVYFRDDGNSRAGLYRLPLGGREGSPADEELVARTVGESSAAFTPGGDLVFSSAAPHKNVYFRYDLHRLDRGATSPGGDEGERRRLTEGLRASSPDVSPDGRKIVFSVNSKGTTHLEIADLDPEGRIGERRTLVASARFDQAFSPRFSPDGRFVAYSAWKAGGYRDIWVVDVATGEAKAVTKDRALDVGPVFSPDGKTLYFSSDRTGIFNVYAHDRASGKLAQVTNVRVAALAPAVSPDGRTLVYVGYGSSGYDLWAMALEPAAFLEALPPPDDRPAPLAEPEPVSATRSRYSPVKTIAPRSFWFDYKPGNYDSNALTLTALGADVVGHHTISASITADPAAPTPVVDLGYRYGRLPADLSLRYFHTAAPRTGYKLGGEDLAYDELIDGVTAGVSYSVLRPFAAHGFGLSFSATHFAGDLPVGDRLEPESRRTVRPAGGYAGIVHLGYAYSSLEASRDGIGPYRGVTFGLGADYAGLPTGSDFSLWAFEASASAYVPMPWPGHQTLALRAAGAIAGGSYSRSGFYYVGGYDLEKHDLFDTVTTGVFNGAFVLRGYEPRVFGGREYLLTTAEYRAPIFKPDGGLSTLPVYLRRLDASLFVDFGGAFQELEVDRIRLFHNGKLVDSPNLHASVGGELWLGTTIAYQLDVQFRFGYAYGFSQFAIPGGQYYFVAASAF